VRFSHRAVAASALMVALFTAPRCDGQTLVFADGFECGDTCEWSWPNPEPAVMTGITGAHNATRGDVDPPASPPIPPLAWNNDLAAVAQAWADNCVWYHSNNGYGENMAAFGGWAGDPQTVIGMWSGESACYDYSSNTCDTYCEPGVTTCGHYTQVVWRSSSRIGCGVRTCTTGSPWGPSYPTWTVWVCNYDPPGNIGSQRPY
jgi:pathogenesis-related protein 1